MWKPIYHQLYRVPLQPACKLVQAGVLAIGITPSFDAIAEQLATIQPFVMPLLSIALANFSTKVLHDCHAGIKTGPTTNKQSGK